MTESQTTPDRKSMSEEIGIHWDERCIRIARSVTHGSYGTDKRCRILDSIQVGLDAAREEGRKQGFAEGMAFKETTKDEAQRKIEAHQAREHIND